MVHDEQGDTGQTDQRAKHDTDDDDAPAVPGGVLGDEGDDVVMEKGAFGFSGVAPDQHTDADGQDGGPPDQPEEAEMQGADDDLDHDQHGNQRDEEADTTTVVDGAMEDAGVLAAHGDEQPGQRVGQDRHPGEEGEHDDADAHPGDVHAEGLGESAADTAEDPVVRVATEVLQPAREVTAALVVVVVAAADPRVVRCPVAAAVAAP